MALGTLQKIFENISARLEKLESLGPGAVQSVFGRKGDVVGESGDYSASLITTAVTDKNVQQYLDDFTTRITALEQGAGGGDAVDSVFGRTGAVTAQDGDYNASQITINESDVETVLNNLLTRLATLEANPYVLPKASADTLGGIVVGNGLSIDKNGVLSTNGGGSGSGDVTSVFGRTGAVTAADGDYNASQIIANDTSTVQVELDSLDNRVESLENNPPDMPVASKTELGAVKFGLADEISNMHVDESGNVSTQGTTNITIGNGEGMVPASEIPKLTNNNVGCGLTLTFAESGSYDLNAYDFTKAPPIEFARGSSTPVSIGFPVTVGKNTKAIISRIETANMGNPNDNIVQCTIKFNRADHINFYSSVIQRSDIEFLTASLVNTTSAGTVFTDCNLMLISVNQFTSVDPITFRNCYIRFRNCNLTLNNAVFTNCVITSDNWSKLEGCTFTNCTKVGQDGSSYTLPVASSTQLGGVKSELPTALSNINIDENGNLSTQGSKEIIIGNGDGEISLENLQMAINNNTGVGLIIRINTIEENVDLSSIVVNLSYPLRIIDEGSHVITLPSEGYVSFMYAYSPNKLIVTNNLYGNIRLDGNIEFSIPNVNHSNISFESNSAVNFTVASNFTYSNIIFKDVSQINVSSNLKFYNCYVCHRNVKMFPVNLSNCAFDSCVVMTNNWSKIVNCTFTNSTKVGENLDYTLPTATNTTLGGVKVGSGLEISENGTLSANSSGLGPDQSKSVTSASQLQTVLEELQNKKYNNVILNLTGNFDITNTYTISNCSITINLNNAYLSLSNCEFYNCYIVVNGTSKNNNNITIGKHRGCTVNNGTSSNMVIGQGWSNSYFARYGLVLSSAVNNCYFICQSLTGNGSATFCVITMEHGYAPQGPTITNCLIQSLSQ